MELYNNIKKRRQALNMTQAELAELVGYTGKSMISKIERGEVDLSQSKIETFARALRTTSGALFGNTETPNTFITYPVIVNVKAGYDGALIFEESGDSEQIPIDWIKGDTPNKFFIASVRGDSMHPLLIDGDRILVHITPSVTSGQIAVMRYNGDEMTVKRVVYAPNSDYFDLIPINPAYPTKRIQGLSLTEAGVVGEVKKLIRNI